MPISAVLEALDKEIATLQQVRALLTDRVPTSAIQKRRGRPIGSANKAKLQSPLVGKKATGRTLTAEGKARIAAAQKARWAAKKKGSVLQK